MSFEPYLVTHDGRHIPVRWNPARDGRITSDPLDISEPVVIVGAMSRLGLMEFPYRSINPGDTYTIALDGNTSRSFVNRVLADFYNPA